jgi:transposase
MRLPQVTAAEWRKIEPTLPKFKTGRPRNDDRFFISAFCWCEATNCTPECLPVGYPNPRSLRVRRLRWQQEGCWDQILTAARPAIARMHRDYWGLIRDASLDWKNSTQFFGRGVIPRLPHTEPRGRYADRRRRVPAGR